ncbi:proline iminopeptidase-family hydrolase [Angustibacter aerolatus]
MRREALGTTVETWYQVVGDLDAGLPPLLVVHGGPGATHDYLLAMADLAGDGRAVVFYDQVGNGRSTHLPDLDPALWTVQLFVDELAALVRHLGLHERGFHLLGQSWGGMLGPEYVLDDPESGLLSLTVADSPASIELWLQACGRLREGLDPDVQAALQRHEDAGTTDSPEYQEAMKVFYDRHVCRVLPNPPEVAATFAAIESDPTVYMAMNGPSEFHVIGSLVGWSLIDRLHRVPVPTLVLAGEHDEAQPEVWEPFTALIPQVRSHVVAGASHMPHVEQPQEFLDVVSTFLRDTDPRSFSSSAAYRA